MIYDKAETAILAALSKGPITGLANVGYAAWPDGKTHRSAQGMALAAGRPIRKLMASGAVVRSSSGQSKVDTFTLAHHEK